MSLSNIPLTPEAGWQELSSDAEGSFTTTATAQHCVYAGQPPSSFVGHRTAKKPIKFTTEAGESVYVRVSRVCNAVLDAVVNVAIRRNFIDLDPVLNSYYIYNKIYIYIL